MKTLLGVITITLALTSSVSAMPELPRGESILPGTSQAQSYVIATYIPWFVKWFMTFASGVAVIAVVVGGFMLVASGGDEGMFKKGKMTVTFAIVGLLVMILSYAIVSIIESLQLPGANGG